MIDLAHGADAVGSAKIDPARGQALLEENCTACHELDENDNHGPDDIAGWRGVVASMVEEGAELDDATATDIAIFLAQKYPAKNEAMPAATGTDTEGETDTDTGGETGTEPESEPESAPQPAPEPEQKHWKRKPKKKKTVAEPTGPDETAPTPPPTPTPAEPAKPAKPKADKANGRALYMAKCKTCHGGDGKGDTSFGRKLGVTPLSGLGKSKIQSAVVSGVPGTKMKSYKKKFTNREIDDVVAFVRGL